MPTAETPDPRLADVLTWRVADWADTAVTALHEIRTGQVSELTGGDLRDRLSHVRQLREMLTAVMDELLLEARTGPGGAPRASWRELGGSMGRDQTSVRERHAKVVSGGGHEWRGQIVWGTGRAGDLAPAGRFAPAGRPADVADFVNRFEDGDEDGDR